MDKKWSNERENLKKVIGQRLRRAREAKGMSQGDLAKLVDKTAGAISNYELGTSQMHVTEIPMFSRILGVNYGYLLGEESESQIILRMGNNLSESDIVILDFFGNLVATIEIKLRKPDDKFIDKLVDLWQTRIRVVDLEDAISSLDQTQLPTESSVIEEKLTRLFEEVLSELKGYGFELSHIHHRVRAQKNEDTHRD